MECVITCDHDSRRHDPSRSRPRFRPRRLAFAGVAYLSISYSILSAFSGFGAGEVPAEEEVGEFRIRLRHSGERAAGGHCGAEEVVGGAAADPEAVGQGEVDLDWGVEGAERQAHHAAERCIQKGGIPRFPAPVSQGPILTPESRHVGPC